MRFSGISIPSSAEDNVDTAVGVVAISVEMGFAVLGVDSGGRSVNWTCGAGKLPVGVFVCPLEQALTRSMKASKGRTNFLDFKRTSHGC